MEQIGEENLPKVVSKFGFTKDQLESSHESRLDFIYLFFERSGVNGQRARRIFDAEMERNQR